MTMSILSSTVRGDFNSVSWSILLYLAEPCSCSCPSCLMILCLEAVAQHSVAFCPDRNFEVRTVRYV